MRLSKSMTEAITPIVLCVKPIPGRRLVGKLCTIEWYTEKPHNPLVISCAMIEGWNADMIRDSFVPANKAAIEYWKLRGWNRQ